MTEEEIDKMADNFVNTQDFTRVYSVARKAECGAFWKYGFLAGLKAGKDTNVPTKWHDLRKDPTDLPERVSSTSPISKTVVNQIGTPCYYHYGLKCWHNLSFIKIATPIAWCEVPTFTDKELDK